jgi:hypothetical protein
VREQRHAAVEPRLSLQTDTGGVEPMAAKRILILANKDWEAEPLVGVLLNGKARPDAKSYPRIPFPDFGAVPKVEVPLKAGGSKFVSARAALYYPKEATPDAIAEVWAIRDLMDPTESGSSSREKARVLPELVKNGRKPTVIIAFGTATTPAARSLNGCVVVGSKVFVHNPLAGTLDPDREWTHDDFGKLMHSREVHPVIDLLDRGQLRSPSEIRFLRSPIHPADPPVLVVSPDFVAVSSVNVTTPALYAWADRQALEAAEKAGIREAIGSVETTHGVIRLVLRSEQFFFVSGIANGLGAFGAETGPRDYAQNFVASHNAAIALAWMLPRLLNPAATG